MDRLQMILDQLVASNQDLVTEFKTGNQCLALFSLFFCVCFFCFFVLNNQKQQKQQQTTSKQSKREL